MIDVMPASLGLEHQGKARVLIDDDLGHGVHHKHEAHETLR